jgi:hypothetical protein
MVGPSLGDQQVSDQGDLIGHDMVLSSADWSSWAV